LSILRKKDLEYGKENNVEIVSKTKEFVYNDNPTASRCIGFTFNKDAGMYVCKAVHMAIKKLEMVVKRIQRWHSKQHYSLI